MSGLVYRIYFLYFAGIKIKKLIKALGGVANAVRIIAGASFSYEKLRALGGAAAALAAELTGIGSVRSACFA